MIIDQLLQRALNQEFLTAQEGLMLFEECSTPELMYVAHELRMRQVPQDKVTWIIDRNSNTTNVCVANCKFCNFYRPPGNSEVYINTIDE